jgi:hypothetical protein
VKNLCENEKEFYNLFFFFGMDHIPKNWIIFLRDGGSFLTGLMDHLRRIIQLLVAEASITIVTGGLSGKRLAKNPIIAPAKEPTPA